MKRFLTILAFLVVTISSYAYECEVDGIYYELFDNEAIVTSGDNKYSGTVVIPEKITFNGIKYTVTSIREEAFAECSDLTAVTIPNSVTRIGYYAFGWCSGLSYVNIPNSVTTIEAEVFKHCSGLTSVTIGNSVTRIENEAFESCSKLTSITIPSSVEYIGYSAFSNCTALTSFVILNSSIDTDVSAFIGTAWYDRQPDGLLYLDNILLGYKNTKPTGKINILDGTKAIAPSAFYRCSDLTSVTIPNSVTSIGESAFRYCSGLTSITIPNSVTSIRDGAFYYCSKLTSVTIPNSVTSIGGYAFYCCSGLTSVTIPNSVTRIGESSFMSCSKLTSITIPSSVEYIGYSAFSSCTALTSIVIQNPAIDTDVSTFRGTAWYDRQPDGLLYLDNILLGYKNTKPTGKINILDGTKAIARSAFNRCSDLTSVTIPNSVTSIGGFVFSYCSGLTSVSIPNSVTSIGDGAFYYCSNLTSVTIPNSVTSIGSSAFSGCSRLTSITIPNSVTSIGDDAFYGCEDLTFMTIPNSVTSIGEYAFSGCSGLTSVAIPNSVTSIGSSAFSGCSRLTSITIPNSVTSIEAEVFYGCSGLKSLTIPNSVTSIGELAFSGCSDLTSITISNSVTSIGEYAFERCSSLTSVTIGNSVKSIGFEAFYYCRNLQELTCFAREVPTLEYSVFSGTKYNTSGVLYVPQGSVEAYKAADQWKDWKSIVGIKESLELIDGEAYTNEEEKTYDELTFTKTFSSSVVNKWNALYVPISINIEDYIEGFDFAEIYNISPTEDTNGDGEIDGRDANKLIVNKLKTGTTDPNKPYLIRPKQAGTYTFASTDNVLYPAEEKSYSCSTMTDEYTFTGLYASQGVTGNDKYYMTINGILDFSPTKTITVKPNRWIMTVKSRNGSSSSANAKAISLSVMGEDEGTTAIEHIDAVRNADVIYNLNGVKMDSKNLPAGIYIKNGKKVFVK